MFLKYLKLKCPIKDINEVVQEETDALLRITQMERRPHFRYRLQQKDECQLHTTHVCKTVTLKYLYIIFIINILIFEDLINETL